MIEDAEKLATGVIEATKDNKTWTLKKAIEETVNAPPNRGGWLGTKGANTAEKNTKSALVFFGKDIRLSGISEGSLEDYQDYLQYEVNNSNATVNKKLSALSKVMSYAERRMESSYSKPRFPVRLIESKHRTRFLRRDLINGVDEEKVVLGYFTVAEDFSVRDATVVLLDTGLRLSELWAVEDRDVLFVVFGLQREFYFRLPVKLNDVFRHSSAEIIGRSTAK